MLVMVFTGTLSAHHSHGNYEMTEYVNLQGVVRELHMVNPHAWIYLEVMQNGESEMWALEAGSLRALSRNGITNDTISVGESVSVRCHQLRDGSKGCLLGFLTGEDGVERLWD
tara:strand:- start:490 stop:828 length:339 start_codon:yes stop_codon:yes gene_type:complete